MKEEVNNIVIGRNPVLELIKSGRGIEKIYLQQNTKGDFEIELRNLLKGKNIPVSHVHPYKLDAISRQNHQGIIAVTPLIEYIEIEDLVDELFYKGEVPNLLFLDSITDVRNLGSIIRTAEVMGAHGVILGSRNTAIINHIAIKASSGAAFNIPIAKVRSSSNAIEYLKNSGINIFASDLNSPNEISEMNFTAPSCVILGSEDTGIGYHLSKIANFDFKIPQFGITQSLNVAVSSGIILYEISTQRRNN